MQKRLVALQQERQLMEGQYTRLCSKGQLKSGRETREKLDLERRIEQLGVEIASLRRRVRAMEGNSLNPGALQGGFTVLER